MRARGAHQGQSHRRHQWRQAASQQRRLRLPQGHPRPRTPRAPGPHPPPAQRLGRRGGGEWQEISWEQALDEIAASIRELTDVHGAEALAYSFGTFHGADWGIGERFLNLFGSPNTVAQDKICYGPGALAEMLTYGFGPSFFTFPIPGKTRCVVIWGFRPSASMPLLWRQILWARNAGAKLIVVDPERVKEVHQADLWLQPLPGTDTAVALGLIHAIIRESRHDAAFVESNTIGFDALSEHVKPYTPAHVESLTSVPSEKLVQAAHLLTENSPGIIHAGNGLCQSGRGAVQTGRAIACLVAITGNLGVEGGHALSGPPHDLLANGDAIASSALPQAQRNKRLGAERFAVLGKGFSDLDAAVSRAWYGKKHVMNWLGSAHEPTLWRAIVDQQPYPVKALVLQHHNPVGASANAGSVAAALAHPNLDLLVAQDLFLNASSSLADYVLPAAHWLEKPFLTMGLGLLGFAGDYVECKPAPLSPSHAHHGDYDLWRDLGRRLGQAGDWPETIEAFWDTCLAPAHLDFATASSHLGPLFGLEARAGSGAASTHDVSCTGYGTPSGKIELRSSLMERWGENPLPEYLRPSVVDAFKYEFPLTLTTGGRRIEGFHQDAQLMPSFRRRNPKPLVSMHPETARQADIREGEWVWLETPLGRVRQCAHLTEDLHCRVIHADRWWYPERAGDTEDPFGWRTTNVNVCTDSAYESCDPVLGTWLLRGLPCRIVKDRDTATAGTKSETSA